MITAGEYRVAALACLGEDGGILLPCGACRELLMQLDRHSGAIRILINRETGESTSLGELVPRWWGEAQYR